LVEGHTETHFMKATYPRAVIQRCIPNGASVAVDRIVEEIFDRLEVLGGDISRVIVLFDREGRCESAKYISEYVIDKLKNAGCKRKVYVGVSDREIENWIVSDNNLMRERYGAGYNYPGDGTNGKAILKALHGGDQAPGEKARLLKSCSPAAAKLNSPSLALFVEKIDFAWPWLEEV